MGEEKKESMLKQLQAGGLTWKALIFSLLFGILWTYIFVIGTQAGRNWYPTPALLILLLLETVVSKIAGDKLGFTPQEWAVFMSISITGLLTGPVLWDSPLLDRLYWGGVLGGNRMVKFMAIYSGLGLAIENGVTLPNGWFPTDPTVLSGFAKGGAPVPWGAWVPSILFWGLALTGLYLSQYFIMLLFRKPWIDVEKLAFPHVIAQAELIKMSEKQDRPWLFNLKSSSSKAFWIVFFVGSVNPLLKTLNQMLNWGYDRLIGQYGTGINLSPYLGTLAPGFSFNFEANGWSMFTPFIYFVPINLIYSYWMGFVVLNYIIPAIFVSTGTAPPGGQWEYGTSQGPIGYAIMTNGANASSGYGGAFFGITAWLVWRYRQNIIHSVKAAIAGSPREPNEPHSWRIVWIGIVGCFLLWYILNLATTGGAGALLLVSYVLLLVNIISRNRIVAETGKYPFTWSWYMSSMNRDAWRLFGYNVTNKTDLGNISDALWAEFNYTEPQYTGELICSTLASFKYGDELKADSRSIGWAYIIATVVGVFTMTPIIIGLQYSIGRDALFTGLGELKWACYGWDGKGPVPLMFLGTPTTELSGNLNYTYWVAGGAIVTFVLFWLHSTFSWFIFNPIVLGFVTGWGGSWVSGGWLVFGLLKWITLRLGAKTYREIGVPAVIGWIAAQTFWSSLVMIGLMWR